MGPLHVSMGLGTMLFGVSGNCDDREVTSLAEEFPREPDSEKDTWSPEKKQTNKQNNVSRWLTGLRVSTFPTESNL